MAGLVPAIHVLTLHRIGRRGCVDARNKSGHDELRFVGLFWDAGDLLFPSLFFAVSPLLSRAVFAVILALQLSERQDFCGR